MKIFKPTWRYNPAQASAYEVIIKTGFVTGDIVIANYSYKPCILRVRIKYAEYLPQILKAIYKTDGKQTLNQAYQEIEWID